MKREIIITTDGSHTVEIKDMKVTYHSHHGAIQESMHVFIEAGLRYQSGRLGQQDKPIRIFEMGFGTGLNTYLSLLEAEKTGKQVYYTAIENYPLSEAEAKYLNYEQLLSASSENFQKLHQVQWDERVWITKNFELKKVKGDLITCEFEEHFDIVYYDAFAPTAQPELWTEEIFRKLFEMLSPGGILVTYCSKGSVRRAMIAAGFLVEKLPGPKGKREMVRAKRV